MAVFSDEQVFKDLDTWLQQEKKLREYFGAPALQSREVQKAKLDFYAGVYRKHHNKALLGPGQNSITLKILKAEIKNLERQLHPSLIGKMGYRAGRLLTDIIRVVVRQRERHAERVSLLTASSEQFVKGIRASQSNRKENNLSVVEESIQTYLKKGMKEPEKINQEPNWEISKELKATKEKLPGEERMQQRQKTAKSRSVSL
jgi:hypothetical protein